MHRLPLKHCCRLTKRCLHHGVPGPLNARQAGFGKVLLFMTPFVAVGGAVSYAKRDRDFRNLLEEKIPGAKPVLKFAVDDEFHAKYVAEQFDFASKKVKEFTEPKTPTSPKTASVAPAAAVAPTSAPKAKPSPAPQPRVETPLPTDVLDLEMDVEKQAALAIKEYQKAIDVLKSFNADVRTVVDRAVEHNDTSLWNKLKNRSSARDTAISTAEQAARDALERISKCEVALSKALTTENRDKILQIRDKIKNFSQRIAYVKDELYKEKETCQTSDKYWRNVEKARNYFIDELESIFPGINLAEKRLHLSQEDLDLFITHAYTHVLAYQKELQRLQTDGELRLKHALEAVRGDNDSEAVKARLDYELEARRHEMNINHQKRIILIHADYERKLREQLKKQSEVHRDHLRDVVRIKENEMKREFASQMDDIIENNKSEYKMQLAAMLGKVRGVDSAMKERAEAERSAHQAQALWAACQALWATVRAGEPGTNWREKLRPLKNEILAVSKVAEGDELVAVVLENLPKEAGDRGVFPEDALRERFLNVERLARKFALVKDGGASLPMYFLSYLQSLFIVRPDTPITNDELQNNKFDFSKLDTYDILNRARYYVDRGDLLQALKYMNLLTGAPRRIACDWLKETRLLLETQQAANTLMAHAAASGLLYL